MCLRLLSQIRLVLASAALLSVTAKLVPLLPSLVTGLMVARLCLFVAEVCCCVPALVPALDLLEGGVILTISLYHTDHCIPPQHHRRCVVSFASASCTDEIHLSHVACLYPVHVVTLAGVQSLLDCPKSSSKAWIWIVVSCVCIVAGMPLPVSPVPSF